MRFRGAAAAAFSLAAMAPAPPPAARGGENKPGGLIGIVLQLGLIYFLYNTFVKGKAPVAAPPASSPASIDTLASSEAAAQQSFATPTPAAGPNLFSMLGLPDPSKVNKVVLPELARYEAEKSAALAAVPAAAKLANLWPSGQRFDLFVFLSTDAAPIVDFRALEGVYGGGRRFESSSTGLIDPALTDTSEEEAPREATGGGGAISLFGGVMQRFISSQAGVARRLANRTFTGLLREAEPSPTSDEIGVSGGGDVPAGGAAAAGEVGPRTALLWAQRGLTYDGAAGNAREQLFNVSLPDSVLTNATGLYAHIYFVAAPGPRGLRSGGIELLPSDGVIRLVAPLVVLLKRKPQKATFNLLEGDGTATPLTGGGGGAASSWGVGQDAASPAPTPSTAASAGDATDNTSVVRVLPYWRPALSIELIHDFSVYAPKSLPPHVSSTLKVEVGPRGVGYTPLAWVNTFWVLGHHLVALNASGPPTVPLTLSYSTGALWKWAMQAQMEAQWEMQAALGGGGSQGGSESDMSEWVGGRSGVVEYWASHFHAFTLN